MREVLVVDSQAVYSLLGTLRVTVSCICVQVLLVCVFYPKVRRTQKVFVLLDNAALSICEFELRLFPERDH